MTVKTWMIWFRRRLAKRVGSDILDASLHQVYPDDIFLVGYPKSGNTWIRYLIGSYLTGFDQDVATIRHVVPGIVEHPTICNQLPRQRFMHTHGTVSDFRRIHPSYTEAMPSVVFIVRDGRDIAVSYYYYLKRNGDLKPSTTFRDYLTNFNTDSLFPGLSWSEYVVEWLDTLSDDGRQLCIVKYEDLLADAAGQLERVMRFAGQSIDRRKVAVAVEASKFDSMRRLEKSGRLSQRAFTQPIPFMRSGTSGQWKDMFSHEDAQQFAHIHLRALDRLGYLDERP